MQIFAAILSILAFANIVAAYPIERRFYQPTSPVFSLIAHHQGAVFQYHLVKFDGHDLTLASDDVAFFGRIKANNGYVLNIPKGINYGNLTNGTTNGSTSSNSSMSSNSSISSNTSSISNSSIYSNSSISSNSSTLANTTTLPSPQNVYIDKNNKLTTTKNNTSTENFGITHSLLTYKNSTKFLACPTYTHQQRYDVYFDDGVKGCPHNATGYDITLLVQVDATVDYSVDTNKSLFKRLMERFHYTT